MQLSILLFALGLTTAMATQHPQPAHRRHHARLVPQGELVVREFEGGGRNDTTGVDNTSSSSSATDSSSTTSSASSTSGTSTSSSSSAATTSSSSSSSSSSSTSSIATSSSTSSSTSSTPASTSTSATSAAASVSTISQPSSSNIPPSTIAAPTTQAITSTVTQSTTPASISTVKSTLLPSASADASNAGTTSSGLSKPAMIAIIVVSVIVGLAAIGWTLFRKYKLKPSVKFNGRMKSIDFGPHGNHHNDDYLEKTLQRSASAHQRNLLAAEVDGPTTVAGIPEHDFTAATTNQHGMPGQPGVYDMYNQDPYYHAEAYEYDGTYGNHAAQAAAYAAGAGVGAYAGTTGYADQPGQDQPINDGYANLQRGNSNGSGSGHGHGHVASSHGHGHAHTHTHVAQPVYEDFPSPENYLGRPTGHNEGPYAQAAQYRTY